MITPAITTPIAQPIGSPFGHRLGGMAPPPPVPPVVDPDAPLRALIEEMFGASEPGALLIPQPIVLGKQVLWQDAAGTVPVRYNGDPVGLWEVTAGNKRVWQDVSAKRGVYRTDGNGHHWIDTAGGAFYNIDSINVAGGCVFIAGEYTGSSGTSIFISGNGPGYVHFRSDGRWRRNFQNIDTPSSLSINASKAQRLNMSGLYMRVRTSDQSTEYTNSIEASSSGLDNAQSLFAYPGGGSSADMNIYGLMLREQKMNPDKEQPVLDYLAGLRP
ncbi:hypothetical protein [Halomonas sp. GD1P12]|uniref:hypothetical protein n=1 Tax=Halomonas sp. GD1P12 TaxID=2982691 RepID=UPI0021E4BD11|nr:hypothetical protein [Halomonas sp. GD1P12]UYF99328.1 hypothetical protein OCT39_13985 [Halomonas sp. GD1P12]